PSAPWRRARVPRSQFGGRNSGITCPSALTMTAWPPAWSEATITLPSLQPRSSDTCRERSKRTWILLALAAAVPPAIHTLPNSWREQHYPLRLHLGIEAE